MSKRNPLDLPDLEWAVIECLAKAEHSTRQEGGLPFTHYVHVERLAFDGKVLGHEGCPVGQFVMRELQRLGYVEPASGGDIPAAMSCKITLARVLKRGDPGRGIPFEIDESRATTWYSKESWRVTPVAYAAWERSLAVDSADDGFTYKRLSLASLAWAVNDGRPCAKHVDTWRKRRGFLPSPAGHSRDHKQAYVYFAAEILDPTRDTRIEAEMREPDQPAVRERVAKHRDECDESRPHRKRPSDPPLAPEKNA